MFMFQAMLTVFKNRFLVPVDLVLVGYLLDSWDI